MRHTALVSLVGLALTLAGCATKPATSAPSSETASAMPVAFPAGWEGTWKGPANLHWPDGRTRAFEMALTIAPTRDPARWTWTVVYSEGENSQTRPYELVVVDAAAGKYAIDEKNSIILPTTMFAGTLRSAFGVGETLIVTTDRMEMGPSGEPTLVSEMLSMNSATPETTGGDEGRGVPPVSTLTPLTLQRAVLKRVK